MEKAKLLLAEDDINLGNVLQQYLIAKGFDVDLFTNGESAYEGFLEGNYDLVILDIMMPDKDGYTVAKNIRQVNNKIPIIFLTAKNLKDDVIKGFKVGADDYITKPFEMEELVARINAVLRRTSNQFKRQTKFKIGNFTFDAVKQELRIGDEVISLTTKENNLLYILALNINELVERTYVLKQVWGDDSIFNARSMDVYITKLRKYLSKDPNVKIINIHSRGFKLVANREGEEEA